MKHCTKCSPPGWVTVTRKRLGAMKDVRLRPRWAHCPAVLVYLVLALCRRHQNHVVTCYFHYYFHEGWKKPTNEEYHKHDLGRNDEGPEAHVADILVVTKTFVLSLEFVKHNSDNAQGNTICGLVKWEPRQTHSRRSPGYFPNSAFS